MDTKLLILFTLRTGGLLIFSLFLYGGEMLILKPNENLETQTRLKRKIETTLIFNFCFVRYYVCVRKRTALDNSL